MKAIVLTSFESGPVLNDLAKPDPAAGEVLVRVHASSINAFDMFVAYGFAKGMMQHDFPVILGRDVAGVVEKVGPGVKRLKVGD